MHRIATPIKCRKATGNRNEISAESRPRLQTSIDFRWQTGYRKAIIAAMSKHCWCVKGVICVAVLCGLSASASAQIEALDKLARDFWAWRAKHAPFSPDDVNRMERPGGMRDWSRASIEQRKKDLDGFETRYKKLRYANRTISVQDGSKMFS